MWRSLATSRAFILVLAVLAWLTVAAVIAAMPVLTRSGEQASPPPVPAATPAPSGEPVARVVPRLALHARAASHTPGGLRLRISTSGSFRPTARTPARLRVVLTAAGDRAAAPDGRIVRRVALTDGMQSAVFRHLRPGTWRWEVTAAPRWTLARVARDSGRVAVTAPSPPPASPAPEVEPPAGTVVETGGDAQAPSTPAYESGSTTTSAPPAAGSSDPTPTTGGGGQDDQPAAPFGGGGAPTPEGPHAP